jgi:hypothetical protein
MSYSICIWSNHLEVNLLGRKVSGSKVVDGLLQQVSQSGLVSVSVRSGLVATIVCVHLSRMDLNEKVNVWV